MPELLEIKLQIPRKSKEIKTFNKRLSKVWLFDLVLCERILKETWNPIYPEYPRKFEEFATPEIFIGKRGSFLFIL